ncbi:major capsid protein E [Alkalilimnicola ehrlichii]|uniref:Major capsid protein E n=1 Tax=Alkalilimnicola ehrlichii TaxID=351052 RepID=A0A3E0WT45_9GAMM|nr:major capsid protein [Alkalilimnicola ehrlichii]RFA24350.1 major capsid protein E [Alkalilimnicola ehrlichii]RFA35137.1 major capsid protein E [Alkalilimnicola ehrlichii]
MATMDIFQQNAFSMVELTAAINKVPFQPSMLGSLGIFDPRPVRTTTVAVEEREGKLSLIQTSERGSPLDQRKNEKRKIRDFRTSRIATSDRIMADELQNIRAFGTETEMEQVQAEIARRLGGPTGLVRNIELTHENMRLGAVQGVVTDADGSVIYDWFQEFGIAQPDEINFALGTATTEVRTKCSQVVRQMLRAAKGAATPQTEVHAICGDQFYDMLISHKSVKETYLNYSAAADLRQGAAFESFRFGGIVFHNYRGTDDGSEVAVDTDKAKFFPVNAPGVFEAVFSPAETFDFVNTPGQRLYSMIIPDLERNMWADIEAYSYPLFMCTNPGMLQSARANGS